MDLKKKRLLRNVLLEAVIYSLLLAAYFGTVLRYLGHPLNRLLHLNSIVYAGAALLLIVTQAVVLEAITSLLIRWLGLETLEK